MGNLVQLFDLTMSKLGALDQTTASTLIARLLDVIGQAPDASSSIDIIAARSSELLSLRATFTDRALLSSLQSCFSQLRSRHMLVQRLQRR